MNSITSHNADYNRLMQASRERAQALRRQAIRELWTGAGNACTRTLRAANRLAARLARHAHIRQGA